MVGMANGRGEEKNALRCLACVRFCLNWLLWPVDEFNGVYCQREIFLLGDNH